MTHCTEEVLADHRALPPGDITGRREWLLVGLSCLFAALRVFLFSAAFPFFNNVDEPVHFDNVCRYSHGDIPREIETLSSEATGLIAFYGSPEYVFRPKDVAPMRMPPPLWRYPADLRAATFSRAKNKWRQVGNQEAHQPPLYYALAGAWYKIGKLLGIEGGNLLYWTRFFNVPVYTLLVWLSYVLAKELFPASRFLYLGVPFLLAFFPQDVFYGLNNDVLSAPLVTLSLILLFRMKRIETPSVALALAAGLATAAAVLTKLTNAPMLAVLGIVASLKLGKPWLRRRPIAEPRAHRFATVGIGHSHRILARAEPLRFGRSDGLCPEKPLHDLDTKAFGGVLEPSDFHTGWVRFLFLERVDQHLLAR